MNSPNSGNNPNYCPSFQDKKQIGHDSYRNDDYNTQLNLGFNSNKNPNYTSYESTEVCNRNDSYDTNSHYRPSSNKLNHSSNSSHPKHVKFSNNHSQ